MTPLFVVCALVAAWPARADVVTDICARHSGSADSFEAVLKSLESYRGNPRVTVRSIGTTHKGRGIPLAIVHDLATPLDSKVRIFVIARQHGTENSGTAACMALLKHFALSQGQLERELLSQMALIVVPVANPDGMCAGQRRNGAGADLNRDWAGFGQPETRAIAAAVKHYRPQAVVDMHELPSQSGKAAYQDNFIETIGKDARLPVQVSQDCSAASAQLASWMGRSGIKLNVFYDTVGDNTLLCHRYFGLTRGIPSYLFEAKCGAGRPLAERMRFHVLGTLVVANHALHRYYQPPEGQGLVAGLPGTPAPPEAAETVAPALKLTQPVDQQAVRGQLPVVAEVSGLPEGGYVLFHLDGAMKALTNVAPHMYLLDTTCYPDGRHDLRVQICSASGQTLGEAQSVIVIDNKVAAGE